MQCLTNSQQFKTFDNVVSLTDTGPIPILATATTTRATSCEQPTKMPIGMAGTCGVVSVQCKLPYRPRRQLVRPRIVLGLIFYKNIS